MKGIRSPVEEVSMSGVISCGGDGIFVSRVDLASISHSGCCWDAVRERCGAV